jgi:serine phosphatase RsbU (regulator of sigma subunit)/putative methionine-R-sulfoxide reductase with GAF domain
MKRLICFLYFFLFSSLAFGQVWAGKVVDTKGAAVGDAEIIINGRMDFTVNRQGTFQFMYPSVGIQKILFNRRGYKYLTFEAQKESMTLIVTVASTVVTNIKGRLVGKDGNGIANAKIILDGLNSVNTTTSNAKGIFGFKLSAEADQSQIGFIINGTSVRSEEYQWEENNVTIKLETVSERGDLMNAKNDNKPDTKTEGKVEPKKIEQNIDKQVINVIVYDENKKHASNMNVSVNGVMHTTDKSGTFTLTGASTSENFNFVVETKEISRISHNTNNVFIYLRKTYEPQIKKEVEEILKDTASIDYQQYDYEQDFNRVVNQLELKKQLLFEKSEHIRDEMDLITAKLRRSAALSAEQKLELKSYLKNLEGALVKNDVAYEEAEGKMQIMVDKMKTTIYEKDSAFSDVKHRAEDAEGVAKVLKIELIIALILGIGMLILAIFMYRQSKRLAASKKEIEAQKVEIEHAYSNIKIISDIGQDITATLDFKELIQTVNDNLSTLMDATFFGVGVVNHEEGKIEFTDFIKTGKVKENHTELLADTTKFSAWCVKQRKTILLGDIDKEYQKYIHSSEFVVTPNMPKSMIYMPLIVEDKVIGVITVQSNNRYAYKEIDVKILQTLDSYIAIAMSNITSYQVINNKNRHITDSIRYAQTIQQAILPSAKQLNEVFTDHFVLYKPKDIVSGDVYWLDHIPAEELIPSEREYGDMTFFAIVDCTGHGVPGGFMSMVANHLLSEIINVKRVYSPDVVLETLDLRVRETLKQYDKVNDDGMDIALCQIRRVGNKVKILYAGARRPLYFLRKSTGVLDFLKGDRASIGGMHRKEHAFTKKELFLDGGDYIYMHTDGLTDQNGGDLQKFSTKRLREFIVNTSHLSIAQQGEMLNKALTNFMKEEEQRDDIAVVGVMV